MLTLNEKLRELEARLLEKRAELAKAKKLSESTKKASAEQGYRS